MVKRIEQRLEIWNIFHEKEILAGKQRPLVVTAKVDNGSIYTVLPLAVAKKLGLLVSRKVRVRFADNRREWRDLAKGLCIRIPGLRDREITTDAIIEPRRKTVLLGCEELERMDMLADHRAGVLRPRPGTEKGITAEID
ncbi:MAG: hypothetical protein HY720_08845 [Planctomycetes bacterium]|nr:hypothetical protein [Planctomycetota bacterium]